VEDSAGQLLPGTRDPGAPIELSLEDEPGSVLLHPTAPQDELEAAILRAKLPPGNLPPLPVGSIAPLPHDA
jgi:hypothetical protein